MLDAGIVTFVPRGDWVNNVTYYPLNIVNYDGLSWIARRENIGQTPADGQYWQPNGTAVPIATTSVAGKVMPDGASITVDQQGHISAVFSADLDDLDNVSITNPSNNQVLKYNATSQEWENGTDTGGLIPHIIVISETGSTVTVSKGAWSTTATETSTGHFECDVPEFGTYTIDAVLAGDDAQVSLVVDAVKIYTVDDSHFHADITVTYPTGATVSCSKTGETPMYATGSPYTFTVHSSGTWTITGVKDGVTVTENVTISTSGQTESVYFENTIEVDLYSAASDTVAFTDETGSKTATTDSTGKAENVSITYSRFKNNAIQFTSSVAKNPSDLTADYTKLIYLDENTTEVKVMPEEASYWYGYKTADFKKVPNTYTWSGLNYEDASTFNTNYVALETSGTGTYGGVFEDKNIASDSDIRVIAQGTALNTNYGVAEACATTAIDSNVGRVEITSANNALYRFKNTASSKLFALSVLNRKYNLRGLWHKQATDYNFFSAANDTVTYKDSNNNDVVFAITDEDGYAKVDYSAVPQGTYTLYSSVAKDPDNLSNAYSKTVTIGNATTSIYFMPNDNVLYWWGYKSTDCVEQDTTRGFSYGSMTWVNPTWNTNDVALTGASQKFTAIGSSSTKSASSVHIIYQGTNVVSSHCGWFGEFASKDFNLGAVGNPPSLASTSLTKAEYTFTTASGYISANVDNTRAMKVNALWYE